MGDTEKNQTLNSGLRFYPIFDKAPKPARQKIIQRVGIFPQPNFLQNRNKLEQD